MGKKGLLLVTGIIFLALVIPTHAAFEILSVTPYCHGGDNPSFEVTYTEQPNKLSYQVMACKGTSCTPTQSNNDLILGTSHQPALIGGAEPSTTYTIRMIEKFQNVYSSNTMVATSLSCSGDSFSITEGEPFCDQYDNTDVLLVWEPAPNEINNQPYDLWSCDQPGCDPQDKITKVGCTTCITDCPSGMRCMSTSVPNDGERTFAVQKADTGSQLWSSNTFTVQGLACNSAPPSEPLTIYDLHTDCSSGSPRVDLKWTALPGADHYEILKCTGSSCTPSGRCDLGPSSGSDFVHGCAACLSMNPTRDFDVIPGQTYTYRMGTDRFCGQYSDTRTITVQSCSPADISGVHQDPCSSNTDCNANFDLCCLTGSGTSNDNECHELSNLHGGQCMGSGSGDTSDPGIPDRQPPETSLPPPTTEGPNSVACAVFPQYAEPNTEVKIAASLSGSLSGFLESLSLLYRFHCGDGSLQSKITLPRDRNEFAFCTYSSLGTYTPSVSVEVLSGTSLATITCPQVTIMNNPPPIAPACEGAECCGSNQCYHQAQDTCISDGEVLEDQICIDGNLALSTTTLVGNQMLSLASGDYVLFCDAEDIALNNLDYFTGSNELISDIFSVTQHNNVCVLLNNDKVYVGMSFPGEVSPTIFRAFETTDCSDAMLNDGSYHACDSSERTWFNLKQGAIIHGKDAVALSSLENPISSAQDTFRDPLQLVLNKINQLVEAPFDESYAESFVSVDRLYHAKHSGKEVFGAIDDTGTINMVIHYSGIEFDLCAAVDDYVNQQEVELDTIRCAQSGSDYYVLAQGSPFTSINPNTVWVDLTSKLRLS